MSSNMNGSIPPNGKLVTFLLSTLQVVVIAVLGWMGTTLIQLSKDMSTQSAKLDALASQVAYLESRGAQRSDGREAVLSARIDELMRRIESMERKR